MDQALNKVAFFAMALFAVPTYPEGIPRRKAVLTLIAQLTFEEV
jgi:hypothetical protein